MKFLSLLLLLVGCSTMNVDPSMNSVDAGDYTLAMSACEAGLGQGIDICRVTEGDKIESSWNLVLPYPFFAEGGEVNVYYKDIQKSYGVTGAFLSIPWADFFGVSEWSRELDGVALALVSIKWTDDAGLAQTTHFRGLAQIVVTKKGYNRLPIDSGYHEWQTKCDVQYSTSGRGALSCQ